MIAAAVGGDDEIGLEIGRERLRQNMDLLGGAGATGRIADDPARRVAGGDRRQILAGLQGDVADFLRRGIEPIERAVRIRIYLDGIDIAVGRRFLKRRAVRRIQRGPSVLSLTGANACGFWSAAVLGSGNGCD